MIQLTDVSKTFTRHRRTAPRSLKEWFVRLGTWRSTAKERADANTLWALRDVSVTVRPGEMLGVIGANGAGKSTLLRLIGGVLSPNGGTVEVGGRIGGLLSLDTGFSDDLTGRENVYTSGVVAGLTRREVTERMDAIIAFAELAHAIDAPLRTYSTGMRLRLGFAVAVHTDPDVLLIDEALSVGDLAFQQKCLARIREYQSRGCALVLVSHSPAQVRQLCDTVLWLRQGRVVACGPPDVVTGQYESEMMAATQRRLPASHPAASRNGEARGDGASEGHPALVLNETRFGSLEATIDAVRLLDETGRATDVVPSGHSLAVEIDYRAPEPIPDPIFSVTLQQADGTDVLDVNTQAEQIPLPRLKGRGTLRVELERIDAGPGQYYVNVGMYAAGWHYAYDFHWQTYPVCVTGGLPAASSWSPPRRWHILTPPQADGESGDATA